MNVRFWTILCVVIAAAVTATAARAAEPPVWDKEVVSLFRTLPVQEGGRVKPLDTYAQFALLRLNGKRTCKTAPETSSNPLARMFGPKRSAIEWLLDCLFFPEIAQDYPVFSVNSSEVIVALGLHAHAAKRDRYSYRELQSGRDKLFELARLYLETPATGRTVIQAQTINLAENISFYENLVTYTTFGRTPLKVEPSQAFGAIFPEYAPDQGIALSDLLRKAPEIRQKYLALKDSANGSAAATDAGTAKEIETFTRLFVQLDSIRDATSALALFPPFEVDEKQWLTPADIIVRAFDPHTATAKEVDLLQEAEALVQSLDNPDEFRRHVQDLHTQIATLARQRGEYGKIGLEVAFYKGKFFYRSFIFYMLCFVLVAISWLVPRNRTLAWLTVVAISVPTILLVTGIVLRCIIRSRPPATTLYETILFTTAMAVVVALFMEYATRQRVALSLGAVIAVLGMLLANKYEAREGTDTMPSMVAILDTNFWLTGHVTTILIGYASAFFAGALAHVYILCRLFGLKRSDRAFYTALSRMTYGILCFSFFFAFLGTLLGGVWANEAWGRFWGWDPKENGALLIVLWQLAMLHARVGGYIRDLGFSIAAVFLASIVAFSWWGVNLLGVGLHSYGFTHGTMASLTVFWAIETFVMFLGALIWMKEKRLPRAL